MENVIELTALGERLAHLVALWGTEQHRRQNHQRVFHPRPNRLFASRASGLDYRLEPLFLPPPPFSGIVTRDMSGVRDR